MEELLYKAIVDGELEVEVDRKQLDELDARTDDGRHFHLLAGNVSLEAQLEAFDRRTRTFVIRLGGERFVIQLKDGHDLLVDRLGLTQMATAQVSDVEAPMPGLVLDILVEPGQTVEPGQKLLVLEAMKMENIIKADGEGTVESVEVEKGNPVDKGQLLIRMK